MNRFLRVNGHVDIIRTPETATAENRKVVIPPNTGLGMATSAAANLLKIPMMSNQIQQQYPALRFAQRVSAITPLFCAKVDIGVIVQRPARIPLKPSASTPP